MHLLVEVILERAQQAKRMIGRHLRSLQRPALLLLLLWKLCQLQAVVSTGHHHNHRRPAQQLSTTGPAPAPFQMPTSPPAPPLFVVPPSYEPSDAPSGLLPFVAPSPLVVPVISNPTQPKLSGLCPFNFTELEDVLMRTAGDCPEPLALYVGSVICCPQLESLFQVSLGQHSVASGYLGLNVTEAAYCFSDTENILSSMGANTTVGDLCSAQPTNLTSGSCPITTVRDFEKLVNTTRFLEACQSVDPLKECTEEPICQIVLTNIAIQMAGGLVNTPGTGNEAIMAPGALQVVIDCQNLALAWLASKLGLNDANTVLRNLISCQVNKECPLKFSDPTPVAGACGCTNAPSNITCCEALDSYLLSMQQQMLITNLQALRCVTFLASTLQNMSVSANIYSLCQIDLKDFSLQGAGGQGAVANYLLGPSFARDGCLLSSLPSDIVSNVSGIDFTCDLNDNIAAPWPHFVSSEATNSRCGRPPVALPALPGTSNSSVYIGFGGNLLLLVSFVIIIIIILMQTDQYLL